MQTIIENQFPISCPFSGHITRFKTQVKGFMSYGDTIYIYFDDVILHTNTVINVENKDEINTLIQQTLYKVCSRCESAH